MSVYAILLCGGSGTRMGLAQNKTLLPVGGIPACVRAGRTLLTAADGLVAVVRAGDEETFRGVFDREGLPVYALVTGGGTRQQSVRRGLAALPEDCREVLIHDGARPLVTEAIVRAVLESVRRYGTGVAAVPMTDTVKRADENGVVLETLDRSRLWRMQTPQGFRRDLLERAHAGATDDLTDDAGLVERLGEPVRLVPSTVSNLKLTDREDWTMAERLAAGPIRVGMGIDAHRLTPGRRLILCGVDVPYERGLDGHSDADVALHALCDALLGAAALGDIGRHFPDTDERYRGVSSVLLTERVRDILAEQGYRPVNVDITIVAQKPKLAPYIAGMVQNVAAALRIAPDCVSVKATTTEHMGYEGRGEGISAQAVATVMKSAGSACPSEYPA